MSQTHHPENQYTGGGRIQPDDQSTHGQGGMPPDDQSTHGQGGKPPGAETTRSQEAGRKRREMYSCISRIKGNPSSAH